MGTTTQVDAAREALGHVGVALPASFTEAISIDEQREAVVRLERAGYRAVWTNEVVGGKDALVQLAVLLAATERMVFGTCIANMWARQPETLHGAASVLAQAYPGRFVLGVGVGYPEQAAAAGREFGSPVATMRDYLERMSAPTVPPAPDAPYPLIIAANGPKLLALAAELTDGALPAVWPAEFTAEVRKSIGPDKLLVMATSVAADDDVDRARAVAREFGAVRLREPSAAATLLRLGYSEQDIAETSDRLVDAVMALGDPAMVAAKVREHVAAGADHVVLLLPIGTDVSAGVERFEQLASALL